MIELSEKRTPVGGLRIAIRGEKLVGLAFLDGWRRIERHLSRWFPNEEIRSASGQTEVVRRLDAYMIGELAALDGIRLERPEPVSSAACGPRSKTFLRVRFSLTQSWLSRWACGTRCAPLERRAAPRDRPRHPLSSDSASRR